MDNFWLPTVSKTDLPALRQFGLGMALALTLIFCLLLPWAFDVPASLWIIPVVLTFLILALMGPGLLYWPYRSWMVFASVLNFINTRMIMAIAYYLLIVPIGLLMKSIGKLQYTRGPARDAATYWVLRKTSPAKSNLKEPF
ncbi:SxtJ family membrane protein [Alteromonas antoniana]|uniref:SxtJ family membrane protein n=1 Tax=Alteromonas antoniana TaxID=2803813 RepID=UPI001C44DA6C|nr:SxtJ family membrane protein [Alteromonas antoniana]